VQLTQTVEFESPSSVTDTYKTTYEYDARGNISKTNFFINTDLVQYVLYEDYDDKFNPLLAVKGRVDPELSKNNYRKRTSVSNGDMNGDGVEEERREVTTYTYKYNASGFVTETTTKEVGYADYVETYTYTGCN
jgi:YD repeat-containing protein